LFLQQNLLFTLTASCSTDQFKVEIHNNTEISKRVTSYQKLQKGVHRDKYE